MHRMNGCNAPQPTKIRLPPSSCLIHPFGLMPGNNSDTAEQSRKADMRSRTLNVRSLTRRRSCARWDVGNRCKVEESHSSRHFILTNYF